MTHDSPPRRPLPPRPRHSSSQSAGRAQLVWTLLVALMVGLVTLHQMSPTSQKSRDRAVGATVPLRPSGTP